MHFEPSNQVLSSTQETVIEIENPLMSKKISVFVTYAWGEEEHNTKVIAFTNLLRQNGFNADLDRRLSQESTSIHWGKMMHTSIQESDKVIVVLSENYKKKAENFEGGVGTEYTYVVGDIDKNKDKYILVSFQKLTKKTKEKTAPMAFADRDIVDLVKDESNGFISLFSKLQSKGTIQFDAVSNTVPEVPIEKIPVFTLVPEEGTVTKIPDLAELSNSVHQRISSDSYFDEYKTTITCKYAVVNNKLVIKKEVDTKIKLINPLPNFIEEANFFTAYNFKNIEGLDHQLLLKLKRLKVKVDHHKTDDMTKNIIINMDANGDSKIYGKSIRFKYQKLDDGYPNSLVIPFENKLNLELKEERIVPQNDLFYFKRINKVTKIFELTYEFKDFDGTIVGTCFSSVSMGKEIKINTDKRNNSITIRTNNWLLPGDGICIILKP